MQHVLVQLEMHVVGVRECVLVAQVCADQKSWQATNGQPYPYWKRKLMELQLTHVFSHLKKS